MSLETILIIFSAIGSLASLIGIGIAIIQTKRLRLLESENKRKTWSQIATTKALMEDLEHKDPDQALGKVFEQFRFLLREAVIQEKNFSLNTINLWRGTGQLSSRWQERQALHLLHTNEIEVEDLNELSADFKVWDENPDNSNLYDHHTNRLKKLKENSNKVEVK